MGNQLSIGVDKRLEKAALGYYVLNTLCYEDLQQLIDFDHIFPYLHQNGLLPPNVDRDALVNVAGIRERVNKIVTDMPRCGKPDYLELFIKYLRESASVEDGVMYAHTQLAETLKQAYQESHQLRPAEKRRLIDCYKAEVLNSKAVYVKKCFSIWWIAVYLSTLLVLLLLGVLPLAMLSRLPQLPINSSLIHKPTTIYGRQTTDIEFNINPFQSLTAEMKIDGCDGTAFVVDGATCDTLQKDFTESVFCDPSEKNIFSTYIYLLAGSLVNIHIPGDIDFRELQIWLFTTAAAYINRTTDTNCNNPSQNAICYKVNNYSGQNITYEVQTAGYHSIITRNKAFFAPKQPNWDFMVRQYNLNAIRDAYSPTETQLSSGERSVVPITRRFDFKTKKCVLLRSQCGDFSMHDLSVTTATKRRRDWYVFPGVILVITIVVLIVIILLHIMCFARMLNRGRQKVGDIGTS